MKRLSNLVLLIMLAVCGVATMTAAKPKIHILATGGTIAGAGASSTKTNYSAGQVAISSLLEAVPQINDIADVTGEQIVSIGSQDMTDDVWLTLANRINELLAGDVDGIVITHGTDTMEETAYFLNLTVKSEKPVVLTGAMRPSTAISADGPLNLYNAVVTAAAGKESSGKGVLIAMNGLILGAHATQKMNTVSVETFQAPDFGALGYIHDGKVYYNGLSLKRHTVNSEFDVTGLKKLPKVGIVYSYSNVEADVMDPFLNNGYEGVVHAGVGNGNFHKNLLPKLLDARKKGIVVVRSSRVPTGPTTLNGEVDDNKYEFVASEELNPQKARVLLMLALTKTKDWKKIQQYFEEY